MKRGKIDALYFIIGVAILGLFDPGVWASGECGEDGVEVSESSRLLKRGEVVDLLPHTQDQQTNRMPAVRGGVADYGEEAWYSTCWSCLCFAII